MHPPKSSAPDEQVHARTDESWSAHLTSDIDLFSSDIHQELAARDAMVVWLLWLAVGWLAVRVLGGI